MFFFEGWKICSCYATLWYISKKILTNFPCTCSRRKFMMSLTSHGLSPHPICWRWALLWCHWMFVPARRPTFHSRWNYFTHDKIEKITRGRRRKGFMFQQSHIWSIILFHHEFVPKGVSSWVITRPYCPAI